MLSRIASSTRQAFTSQTFSGICASPGTRPVRVELPSGLLYTACPNLQPWYAEAKKLIAAEGRILAQTGTRQRLRE